MTRARSIACPTCRRPALWEGNPYRPFCSERCQMVDLGNWALERYRIAGEPVNPEPSADDPAAAPGERRGEKRSA